MRVYLETERLILREFTAGDLDLLVELDSDPEVMRYLSGGVPTPVDEVKNRILPFILELRAGGDGLGMWAALDRTGEFLGWFMLRRPKDADVGTAELGYRLRKPAWGRGYATEGSRALLAKGFTDLGLRDISAYTMAVNAGSRKVMEKLGMTYRRTFFEEWAETIEGSEHGEVEYGITSEEWANRSRPMIG